MVQMNIYYLFKGDCKKRWEGKKKETRMIKIKQDKRGIESEVDIGRDGKNFVTGSKLILKDWLSDKVYVAAALL